MTEISREHIISGFRPTSDLTIGNYLGAIRPVLDIQAGHEGDLYVFVADLHGLTDHDPREIAPYREEVVADCLALGVDPDKTTIYLQSAIEAPVVQIANRLAPYISVSELARTPNLKEKMQTAVRKGKSGDSDELSANFGLLGYPVLMAADIFAQDTRLVAVGADQEPHLELARTIARRFNGRFEKEVIVVPQILALESLRILGLDGKGKMSKTNPGQAILLSDDPEEAIRKIQKATTANSGEWNEVIASHFKVVESIGSDKENTHLAELRKKHMEGARTMADFKKLFGDVVARTLEGFQDKRSKITDTEIQNALSKGSKKATENAESVLNRMKEQMGF